MSVNWILLCHIITTLYSLTTRQNVMHTHTQRGETSIKSGDTQNTEGGQIHLKFMAVLRSFNSSDTKDDLM